MYVNILSLWYQQTLLKNFDFERKEPDLQKCQLFSGFWDFKLHNNSTRDTILIFYLFIIIFLHNMYADKKHALTNFFLIFFVG